MRIECVARTADILGEVPLWHAEEQALYWVDLFKPALHRLDPATGAVSSVTPATKLGSYGLRRGGGFLLAGRRGIELAGPDGQGRVVADPEEGGRENILNDGRCDRAGRFWVGSMSRTLAAPTGRLYRIAADSAVSVQDVGIYLPNSLAWSPDDRVMYFADSHTKMIFAYDFDIAAGTIANRRVFATCEGPGVPDGSSVDRDGFLWNAVYDGARLVRYAPDGRVDRVVEVPVSKPSACTFGGPGFETLYVTTATFRMPDETRAREPMSGGVLALDVGVAGLPEPFFAG